MNTLLEQINSTGTVFVEFAVPMLIQSSALIVILLLADLVLRKKVKAVFRYCVWMLVLVKLILPTSLSSPLSVGYWFGDKLAYVAESRTSAAAEVEAEAGGPALANMLHIIETAPIEAEGHRPAVSPVKPDAEAIVTDAIGPPVEPAVAFMWEGVVFLVWLAVVSAMGLLLLQRAMFVRGLVAQAKEANDFMNDALKYCCKCMGVKRRVGLKVSAASSPAVCGLFRPVILLPDKLAPSVGSRGLRAVLLHELAHIRRRDLWVNLAQTVLQIVYFYNPLLWLANCVIRRVREQAIDETVLVAMGEKAQQYPQALVNVAKLAFKRPVLSLRLIGVVESKSALAGRIKHILNRPMPKSAKIGIVGVLAVIIAGAILLPMAKAEKADIETDIQAVSLDHFVGKYAPAKYPDEFVLEVMKKGDEFVIKDARGPVFEMKEAKDGFVFANKNDEQFRIWYNASEDSYYLDILGIEGKGWEGESGRLVKISAEKPGDKTGVPVEGEQSGKSTESKASESTVDESVEHSGRIRGVVVSSVTGEPIAGAYVGVGDFGDSGGSNYSRHRSQGFYDKTETDEKGRFELEGLVFTDEHPYWKYHALVVTHPDFVRHDEKIELSRSEPVPDVTVKLRPAATINVTVVDVNDKPLKGLWLFRMESLEGRRFIPPGQDRHLSAFASSVWLEWPGRRQEPTSEGFSFKELDTGEYRIEVIQMFISDAPTRKNPWAGSVRYYGAIPNLKLEAGETKEVQVRPMDYQNSVTIKMPKDPFGKLEDLSMVWVTRKLGLLLDTTKLYHPEDDRLGRPYKSALFYGPAAPGDVFTIRNFPPDSYSVFAVYYGKVPTKAVFKTVKPPEDVRSDFIGPGIYMSSAKMEVSRGHETTVELPPIELDGVGFVKTWTFGRKVKLEAKEYSVKELCTILTKITESDPRLVVDPSIENEKLKFREEEVSIWDVLESICLEKGWRLGEVPEGTLVLESKKSSAAGKLRVYLPDLETPNANVILDLATGEMLQAMWLKENGVTRLGKGDVVYEYSSNRSSLLCLRGATMQLRTDEKLGDLKPDIQREYSAGYLLKEVPRQYRVTTAEGDKYELKVISIDKGDTGGAFIQFWKSEKQMTAVPVEGEEKSNSFAQEQIFGSADKLVSEDLQIIPVIKPHITIEHKSRVDTVLFLPNGKALISESFGEGIKVSDTQSGTLLRTFPRGYAVNSMAMSHNGATLAIGTNRGTAEIWSIETLNLEKRFQVTEWSIYAVAQSPNGKILASCAADGTVQLWDIKNSKLLKSLGKKSAYRMSAMSFSPDSKVLANLTRDGRADMWDVVNGQLIGTLPTKADSWGSCSINFCPDANTVAIATPGLVQFWKPENNNQLRNINVPDSINPLKTLNNIEPMSRPIFVGMVVLSHDCGTAASVIEDGSIVVWDVQTRTVQLKLVGSRIPDLMGGGIETMAFSPDKSLFASGNRNGKVQLWKLDDRIKSKKPMNIKRQLDGTVEIPDGRTAFPGLLRPGDKMHVPVEVEDSSKPAIQIESRFLMVSEELLEDIGLKTHSIYNADGKFKPAIVESPASPISETHSFILDDINVSSLVRAVQAREDSKALAAPRVTVFDGEEAAFSIHTQVNYISGYTEPTQPAGEPEPKHDSIIKGITLQLTPKISPDNENILLDVDFKLSNLLGFEERMYKEKYPYKIPQTEVVSTQTRLLVPDGQTVLVAGRKVTAEEDGRKVQKELLVLIKAKKDDELTFELPSLELKTGPNKESDVEVGRSDKSPESKNGSNDTVYGSVTGTVRFHGTGAPAAGVVVKTVSKWFDTVQARTDEQGSYTLAGIRPEAVFHVSAEDEEKKLFMNDMPAVVLKAGEAKTGVDLAVYAGRKGSISGKVVGRRVFYQKPERLTRNIVPENFERRQDTPLSGVKIVLRSNTGIFKETITDEKGGYRFEGLRADGYVVRAEQPAGTVAETVRTLPMAGPGRAESHGSGQSRWVELKSEAKTDVDFHFRLDWVSIAGRVTDADGNPVGGAEVVAELCTPKMDGGEGRSEEFSTIKISWGSVSTISGADGRYRLDGLCPVTFSETATYLIHGKLYRRYEVRIQAEGYSPTSILVPPVTEHLVGETSRLMEDYKGLYGEWDSSSAEVALPETAANTITGIDFVMEKSAVINGRVLDTQGNVVPGPRQKALVRMVPADSRDDKNEKLLVQMPDRIGLDWIVLDEAGRFKFDGVHAGSYFFEIKTRIDPDDTQRARNETLVVKAGEVIKDIEVVVESAADRGNISGRVLDAGTGKPIEAFSVWVSHVDSPEEPTPVRGGATIDKSQKGAFLVEGVSPGTATLEILASGYVPKKTQVKVASGQTTGMTFHLEQRGKISGRVLDARSGKAVEAFSAKVTRVNSAGERAPALGRTTIDKSQKGVFIIEDISTGTATLEVSAPGYAREKVQVKVVSGQTTDMTFNLEQGGKLQVYVTLNGKGQMAWVVSARPAGEGPDAEISTQMGKDGRYELTGLKRGEHLVRAPVPLSTGVRGRATVQINNRAKVKIEPGKETRLDFELRDNAGIRGTFAGPDKDLSWRILIFDDSAAVRDDPVSEVTQAHALVWKLEQGEYYEINCLPPGTYRVVGRCCKKEQGWTGVMEKSKTVTLKAGQTARVDFVFS